MAQYETLPRRAACGGDTMTDPTERNNADRDELLRALKESPSYVLAYEDVQMMQDDDLRPVRLQLELYKPEKLLQEHNIRSTIVVFGSARTMPPDVARDRLDALREEHEHNPENSALERKIAKAKRDVEYSQYYEEARRFSQLVSTDFIQVQRKDFVIVTGGGPGIMEAANRGAHDVHAVSAGFNITLPQEQEPNPYISPELCFRFRYFALRKMHFMMRAKAVVTFPGGYGTLDELFDALCLVQTRKVERMPIILVGREFWRRVIDFDFLVEEGMISAQDVELFNVVDTAQEAVDVIYSFYGGGVPE
jgi:uncharacterized protein (TIGR00730 family)